MPKTTKAHANTILHQNLPLVEVAEPWLLDTILADASAARWIVTRLSDRVAIIAPGQVDALLAFPFVVRSLLPALRGLDPRLREAARTLGAGPAQVLREVDLPLLFPALLVGAVFAFTVSIGEFGAALLLYRPEYPTVPVVIDRFLGLPGQQNYGQALALSTILMLITGLSFVLLEQVRFRDIGEF